MSQNRLALNAQEYVRKAVSDSSDDEIALDCLAQWAANNMGKEYEYGIEENYPVIRENISSKFNISDSIASDYVSRLREYGTQFMLSGADIGFIRGRILEELGTEYGKKLRQGMLKRFAKSSSEAKRLAFLIFHLLSRGLDPRLFERSLDVVQVFHVASFEKPFGVQKQDELIDIGMLNRLYESSNGMTKRFSYTINSLFPYSSITFDPDKMKVQKDAEHYVSHLYEKKSFDQLQILDELCSEPLGLKKFENAPNFIVEKKVTGKYGSYFAISPFLLTEIRDDIRALKHGRIDEYELRIDTSLLKVIRDSWPDGKLDLVHLANMHALWRIDNQVDPKLYVLLAPWISKESLADFTSTLEVPKVSTVICIVLSQSPESANAELRDSVSEYGQLVLVYPTGQKESKSETLAGNSTNFSNRILSALARSLNLSISQSDLEKAEKKVPQAEVGRSDQFGSKPERPKTQIGILDTIPVYWSPTRERNWNLGVFGDAGTGKTQLIKKVISQIKPTGIPYIILDSFSEFVSKDGSTQEFGTVVNSADLNVNPLELLDSSPDARSYSIASTISAVFELSEQQVDILKSAIRSCYESKGILQDDRKSWLKTPPTLPELKVELGKYEQKEAKELVHKIGPALGIQLYSSGKSNLPFDKIVGGPMVVNLGSLQTSEMKTLASEFILGKVPSAVAKNFEEPQLFVVVDGAPNLFRKGSNSLRLLVEARRRGVGIIYPYRDPSSLPEIAFNHTATIVSFKQSDSKALKITSEKLAMEEKALKKSFTDKFFVVAKFSSMADATKLKALPYSQKSD